jgi:hypothetical protein
MSFDPVSAIFDLGKSAIERIWPDPIKRAEEVRKLEEMRQTGDLAQLNAHVQLMLGQLEVNKAEAQHKSIFVAGWRPAVGWVCVAVMAFNYVGVYLMEFAVAFIDNPPPVPTRFDMSELWPILLGMLGIGTMRSVDKKNGNQTDSI